MNFDIIETHKKKEDSFMKKDKRKLITSLASTGIVSTGFAVSSFVVPNAIDTMASSHPPHPWNQKTGIISGMSGSGSVASLFSQVTLEANLDILIEQNVYNGKLKRETHLNPGTKREYTEYLWFDDRVGSSIDPWKTIEFSSPELKSYTMDGWGVKNPENIVFGDRGFSPGGIEWNFWYGVFEYSPAYAYVDNRFTPDFDSTKEDDNFKIILEGGGITMDFVEEPNASLGSTQDRLNWLKKKYPPLISKESGEWKYQELIGKGYTLRINKTSFEDSFYKEIESTSSFRFSDDIYSSRTGRYFPWSNEDGDTSLESIFLSQKS